MSWTTFILGRPGYEYEFQVPPGAMTIDESGIISLQRDLAGNLHKSTLKNNVPTIKINSNYLMPQQRNQFNSLIAVSDTFLSFICRDDWTVYNELATVLSSTTLQLQNSSALRLSAVLAALGFPSIISNFQIGYGVPLYTQFGQGVFGQGVFGGGAFGGSYNPGTITYVDSTYIVTVQNPLPLTTVPVYVTYTYKGWLVNMDKMDSQYQGGWGDRAKYDFQLQGA